MRSASGEGARNSPLQGCLSKFGGPGTWLVPWSQTPRAPNSPEAEAEAETPCIIGVTGAARVAQEADHGRPDLISGPTAPPTIRRGLSWGSPADASRSQFFPSPARRSNFARLRSGAGAAAPAGHGPGSGAAGRRPGGPAARRGGGAPRGARGPGGRHAGRLLAPGGGEAEEAQARCPSKARQSEKHPA